jgi:hypothetical protein
MLILKYIFQLLLGDALHLKISDRFLCLLRLIFNVFAPSGTVYYTFVLCTALLSDVTLTCCLNVDTTHTDSTVTMHYEHAL